MNTLLEWIAAIIVLGLFALIVIGLSNALLGCTPAAIKPQVTLQDPVLPIIHRSEVSCLTDTTWEKFWEREIELRFAYLRCKAAVEELTR